MMMLGIWGLFFFGTFVDPVEVDQQIKALEAPTLTERRNARMALMAMGPDAFGILRERLEDQPFAVEQAIRYVLDHAPPRPQFVSIKGAEPQLGSKVRIDRNPLRKVKLPAYEIGKREVTCLEYALFLQNTPSEKAPEGWIGRMPPYGEEAKPVVNVSYESAARCATFFGARLPTADEWEYAARGPEGRPFPWGGEKDYEPGGANLWGPNGGKGRREPGPVGSYLKDVSPFDVFDMAGNVREWVHDPTAPQPGSALKGGSFNARDLAFARLTIRAFPAKSHLFDRYSGFRLAR